MDNKTETKDTGRLLKKAELQFRWDKEYQKDHDNKRD